MPWCRHEARTARSFDQGDIGGFPLPCHDLGLVHVSWGEAFLGYTVVSWSWQWDHVRT